MIKKQVNFADRQYEILSAEAKNKGISFAEIIRRILDAYLDEKKSNEQK